MASIIENLYVGDGTTVLYSFTFPYINEEDVKVSLNQLDTTAFTLANATTVELDVAPANGVSIRIYRSTPTDAIAAEFFPGSAIRAQDLNNNFEQTLYVVQENQAIIENSDAASVTAIANEALATANQANNTANAISGTANAALTSATEAETVANQASSNATTAQSTALAAQITADAALSPSSVIGDLSNVSNTAPASDQVLAWNGSQWSPVDQTGIGGTIAGASAWGNIAANGTVNNGLNIASVTKSGAGDYNVTFQTPLPSANYSVVVSVRGDGLDKATVFQQTTTGFQVICMNSSTGSKADLDFNFQVESTNALPPKGGTGTDAWGRFEGDGTLIGGFNVSSVTRSGEGVYSVVFTTPMPNSSYAVTSTNNSNNTRYVRASTITSTGFQLVSTNVTAGTASDGGCGFTVNATNAQLPDTFTIEQFNNLVARVTALENA